MGFMKPQLKDSSVPGSEEQIKHYCTNPSKKMTMDLTTSGGFRYVLKEEPTVFADGLMEELKNMKEGVLAELVWYEMDDSNSKGHNGLNPCP